MDVISTNVLEWMFFWYQLTLVVVDKGPINALYPIQHLYVSGYFLFIAFALLILSSCC